VRHGSISSAKQQVLLACMQSGYYFGPLVAIFTSVIGAAYYLRIIKFLYFCDNFLVSRLNDKNGNNEITLNLRNIFTFEEENENSIFNIPLIPSNHLSLIIALLTCITIFFILKPFLLLNIISIITLSLS
jgi:NADH:ubiquinone oxidoreductase subunit 2 (subunit N)